MKKENVYEFYKEMERKVSAGKSIKGVISEFKQFVNTCGLCLDHPSAEECATVEMIRNMLSFKMSELDAKSFLSIAKIAIDNLANFIGEGE